jgi:UDP-N-acetylmuramate dehydrogenase
VWETKYWPCSGREKSRVTRSRDLTSIAEERGLDSRLIVDEPMSKHTSYRIGGPADFFTAVTNGEQLRGWVVLAQELGQSCLVIGRGTNLLVADEGFRGLVVENRCSAYSMDDDSHTLQTEAGVPLARLARETSAQGLGGLEWAVGIPGTVGGAIVNNAGAYESSIEDSLERVTILDRQGQTRQLTSQDLGFEYRSSRFKGQRSQGEIILASDLALTPESASALEERIEHYTRLRRETQPREPSAGSVFKNPDGLKAGKLIEEAGLRGMRIGNAEISQRHANYIVNKGQATADQVWQLIELIRAKVWELSQVRLELEIELVGAWPEACLS